MTSQALGASGPFPLPAAAKPPPPLSDALRRAYALEAVSSARGRALPEVPPAGLLPGSRSGGGRADADERDRARADPSGVPVRRSPRHGQDVARAHPREGAELRAGPDADPRQRVPRLPRDRGRNLARRRRDGRGLAARDRRHPRDPRARRPAAGRGALQGLHPRRGAPAHGRRLQRAAEADRGASAPPRLRLLHHRPLEDAADGPVALPDVRRSRGRACRSSSRSCAGSPTARGSRRPMPPSR